MGCLEGSGTPVLCIGRTVPHVLISFYLPRGCSCSDVLFGLAAQKFWCPSLQTRPCCMSRRWHVPGWYRPDNSWLTLNIPSLGRQRCLPSWGPRRTPWFFCNFSTVWCGRLLKLCYLGFWIQQKLANNIPGVPLRTPPPGILRVKNAHCEDHR